MCECMYSFIRVYLWRESKGTLWPRRNDGRVVVRTLLQNGMYRRTYIYMSISYVFELYIDIYRKRERMTYIYVCIYQIIRIYVCIYICRKTAQKHAVALAQRRAGRRKDAA